TQPSRVCCPAVRNDKKEADPELEGKEDEVEDKDDDNEEEEEEEEEEETSAAFPHFATAAAAAEEAVEVVEAEKDELMAATILNRAPPVADENQPTEVPEVTQFAVVFKRARLHTWRRNSASRRFGEEYGFSRAVTPAESGGRTAC